MLKIDGKYYYIDFETMSSELEKDESLNEGTVSETTTTMTFNDKDDLESRVVTETSRHKPKEVDGFKYQWLSTMLEIVVNHDLEFDAASMKIDLNEASSSFIFAFNTLLKLKIIKEI